MPAADRVQVDLIRHPRGDIREGCSIRVAYRLGEDRTLELQYVLTGPLEHIRLPDERTAARTNELWKRTCFEVFIAVDGSPAYFEFNLSPSSEWASYRFDAHRTGMTAVSAARSPGIRTGRSVERLQLDARLALDSIDELRGQSLKLALAAVVESDSGTLSYWALKHPAERPDFHHPDSFAITLR